EQSLHPATPVAAVEVDLGGETLDRVPGACFVTDAGGQFRDRGERVLRIRHPTALKQQEREPVASVECETGQHTLASLVPDGLRSRQRLVQPADASQRARAREQRREVRVVVETARNR